MSIYNIYIDIRVSNICMDIYISKWSNCAVSDNKILFTVVNFHSIDIKNGKN